MTALGLDISHTLYKLGQKLDSAATAFFNSKFMKAYEEAAIRRAQYYTTRSTMKELHALTDKELRDIGISRGEIEDIARNPYTAKTK